MGQSPALTTTSYAILGQLALRPWTTYELAREMQRNLRFFWPRAERGTYAEAKRLAGLGLATTAKQSVGRRPKTLYSITPAGRRALRRWLATPPAPFALEFEALLRVFFAPLGSEAELLDALAKAMADANALLEIGKAIGKEYLAGRAPFQKEVATRAFVFDFLTDYAGLIRMWAERTAGEIAARRPLPEAERRRRAFALIERRIESLQAFRRAR